MAVYEIDEAHKWLAAVDRDAREATLRGLRAAALRMVNHIQSDIIPNLKPAPIGRGTYRAAWHTQALDNGAEVINTVTHALFIEHGVRAENVKISRGMIAALTEWVRMKNIGGSVRVSKSGVHRLVRPTKDEAESIAWAIAKAMTKRGIFGEGFKVLERAGKEAPRFIREEVARELRKRFGG